MTSTTQRPEDENLGLGEFGIETLAVAELDSDSLPIRLRNSAARLLQPYL